MKIKGENPLNPCLFEHIGHQFGGDRRAGFAATVLARIAKIRDHSGDAAGRRAFQSIGDDQKLHERIIGGAGGWLDDEHILIADIFEHLDENFAIVEPFNPRVHKIHIHAPMQRHAPCH